MSWLHYRHFEYSAVMLTLMSPVGLAILLVSLIHIEPIVSFIGFNICFFSATFLARHLSGKLGSKFPFKKLLMACSVAFIIILLLTPTPTYATKIAEFQLPDQPAVRGPMGIAVYYNTASPTPLRIAFTEKSGTNNVAGSSGIGLMPYGTWQPFYEFSTFTAGSEPRRIVIGARRLGAPGTDCWTPYIWFTQFAGNRIGRLDPIGGGYLIDFMIPTANSGPWGLAVDKWNQSLWFTEYSANKVGKLFRDPTYLNWGFVEYALPYADSYPLDILVDNEMYFDTSLTVPTSPYLGKPGRHAYIWFTEYGRNAIGKLNPWSGVVVEYSVNGRPWGIAQDLDHFIWFTLSDTNMIGRLNPWTGTVTYYPIPTPGSDPRYIVVDNRTRDVWFTEYVGNKIGRYIPGSNMFVEYPVPSTGSRPLGITIQYLSPPDNFNIWFTEEVGNKIGQLKQPDGPTVTTTVGWITSAATTTSSATTVSSSVTSTGVVTVTSPLSTTWTWTFTELIGLGTYVSSTTFTSQSSTYITDWSSILSTSSTTTGTITATATSITFSTTTSTSTSTSTSTVTATSTTTTTSTSTSWTTETSTTSTTTTFISTSFSPTITTPTTTTSTAGATSTTSTTTTLYSTSTWATTTTSLTTTTSTLTAARPALCPVAAAYGSGPSSEVQSLRSFRDQTVLSTFAGSQFMAAFNQWYYSFSPYIAEFVVASPTGKAVAKVALYPLIGILHLSATVNSMFNFNPELGVILAGVTASSLIGAVYCSLPVAALMGLSRRLRMVILASKRRKLAVPWLMAGTSLIIGEILISPVITMFAAAALVLIALGTSTILTSMRIMKRLM